MNTWVFTISWNEKEMMGFFLRHYSTFSDKIIVYDEHSTDGTRDIVKACPKAELRDWPWQGMDDDAFTYAVNNWYKEARGRADWVMWPDVDELIYHPDPVKVLSESKGQILQATGYALIGANGVPTGKGQVYDYIKTGFPQGNYDKGIIWRPEINIQHTIGRHTYGGMFPNGGKLEKSPFKLLHCHYFSVDYTRKKNARNYNRNPVKKYAWNYDAEHNADPQQVGSVAWVQRLIDNKELVNVI